MQHYEIFLFVNPKSGGKLGKNFLQNEYSKIEIEMKKGELAIIHLIDLTNVD